MSAWKKQAVPLVFLEIGMKDRRLAHLSTTELVQIIKTGSLSHAAARYELKARGQEAEIFKADRGE